MRPQTHHQDHGREETIGMPAISQAFLNFESIKFDSQNRVFVVNNPLHPFPPEVFQISQVERIIRFHNEAVATATIPTYVPGGQDSFAGAWNKEPRNAFKMVHRLSTDDAQSVWVLPNQPVPAELISFPHHNEFGHLIDPRLEDLGAYGGAVNAGIVSDRFVAQFHRLLNGPTMPMAATGKETQTRSMSTPESPSSTTASEMDESSDDSEMFWDAKDSISGEDEWTHAQGDGNTSAPPNFKANHFQGEGVDDRDPGNKKMASEEKEQISDGKKVKVAHQTHGEKRAMSSLEKDDLDKPRKARRLNSGGARLKL